MTALQIEILLLLPFGMLIIKAIQALTDEGGLLRFCVGWIEKEIDFLVNQLEDLNKNIDDIDDHNHIGLNLGKTKENISTQIEEFNSRLYLFLFCTKPLYRCPVCMASIWGSLTWLWWVQFSPLPIATWPIFCLMLCGAMYIYENRYSPEIFIKNEINPNNSEDE